MRLAVALLLSALSAHAVADLGACVAEADELRQSGKFTPIQRAERVRDCNNAANGRNVFSDEYWAYYVYVASEFEAGRLTQQQAQYMAAQKQSEVEMKRNAAIMQLAPLAVPRPNPFRSFTGQGPTTTNCTRDPWGNVSCTTQ